MAHEADRLLTTQEVADRLRLKVGTIENWRYLGKGPKWIRIGGGTIRYPEHDVEEWIQSFGGK